MTIADSASPESLSASAAAAAATEKSTEPRLPMLPNWDGAAAAAAAGVEVVTEGADAVGPTDFRTATMKLELRKVFLENNMLYRLKF